MAIITKSKKKILFFISLAVAFFFNIAINTRFGDLVDFKVLTSSHVDKVFADGEGEGEGEGSEGCEGSDGCDGGCEGSEGEGGGSFEGGGGVSDGGAGVEVYFQ